MIAAAVRLADRIGRGAAYAGSALLVVGMLITVADIVMRKTVGFAIQGTVDLTQLFVICVVFLGMPYAFISGAHVSVDMVTDPLPARARAGFKALAAVLGAAVMVLVFVYGLAQARLQFSYGDISQTLGIPIVFYWVPLLAGVLLSALATILMALAHLVHVWRGDDPLPALPSAWEAD